MLHNFRFFSPQNAVYFIMLPFLVPVLFAFYLQSVLKFKCKIPAPKGRDKLRIKSAASHLYIPREVLKFAKECAFLTPHGH